MTYCPSLLSVHAHTAAAAAAAAAAADDDDVDYNLLMMRQGVVAASQVTGTLYTALHRVSINLTIFASTFERFFHRYWQKFAEYK